MSTSIVLLDNIIYPCSNSSSWLAKSLMSGYILTLFCMNLYILWRIFPVKQDKA